MRVRELSATIGVLALCLACAKQPVPVGFVGPLTGPSSAVGLGGRNGFLLAMGSGPGSVPAAIGPTRLIIKDDGNDQEGCLQAFKELKEEGCRLVVLATTSQAATKAIPWAMEAGMLVLSPTVSNPLFSGADDLFFRINSSSGDYGKRLADVASRLYGKRRVGILGDLGNELYVKAVTATFKEDFTAFGGKVAFDRGFRASEGLPGPALLADIRTSRADALLVIAASTEAAMTAKLLEKAGMGLQLFFPPWPLTLDLIKNGGEAVEGAVAVSIADMEYRSAGGKAFMEDYLKEYGEAPSFTAMFGYEAASVLRRALSAGKAADPQSLKKRILEIREFPGLQGRMIFDANGDATRDLFLFKVEDGAFKRIGQ